MTDFEDFCPVGECCVCGEPVVLNEMGNCGTCGGVFHWSLCGEWGDSEHECNKCKETSS